MTLKEVAERRFKDRCHRVTETIIGGLPKYEEYRFQLGVLRGMYELWEDIEPLLRDPDSAFDEEDDR